MQAVRNAAPQFEAHVRVSAEDATRRDERPQRWLNNAGAVLDIAGLLNPLEAVSTLTEAGADGLRHLSKKRGRRHEVRHGHSVDLDSEVLSEADRYAGAISTMARNGLPIVIAVDDAHWADRSTVRFLESLLQADDAAVLVLATAWDHELTVQKNNRTTGSFGHWLSTAEASERVATWQMGPMHPSDLAVIVRSAAPRTPDATVSALATAADGNPLVLDLFLELDVVRRDIQPDGSIDLDPEMIRRVPADLQSLYQELWRDLPEGVRLGLVIAALQGSRFVPEIVDEVAANLGVHAASEGLVKAGEVFRWVTDSGLGYSTFTEGARWEVAADRQVETFSDEELDQARRALIDHVLEERASAGWSSRSEAARRLMLELVHDQITVEEASPEVRDEVLVELLELVSEEESQKRVELRRQLVDLRTTEESGDETAARADLLDELAGLGDSETLKANAGALRETVARSAEDLQLLSELSEELTEDDYSLFDLLEQRSVSLTGALPNTEAEVGVSPSSTGTSQIAAYEEWKPGEIESLVESTPSEVAELIRQAAMVEGPVTVGRLYRALLDASPAARSGRNIRAAFDRGLRSALQRRIVEVAPAGPLRGDGRVVHLPGSDTVCVRELGPRSLDDIPRDELLAVGRVLAGDVSTWDELTATVARFYGIKRRSQRVTSILEDALEPLADSFSDRESPGASSARSRSEDELFEFAEECAIESVFADLWLMAEGMGLATRVNGSSLAISSYSDRRRTLVSAAPLPGGRLAVGFRPANWERAFPISGDYVAEVLGEQWVELDEDGAFAFMGRLFVLIREAWFLTAEDTPYMVMWSHVDESGDLPLESVLFWSDTEAQVRKDYDEVVDALVGVVEGADTNEFFVVTCVRFDNDRDERELLQLRIIGGEDEARANWESLVSEEPLSQWLMALPEQAPLPEEVDADE